MRRVAGRGPLAPPRASDFETVWSTRRRCRPLDFPDLSSRAPRRASLRPGLCSVGGAVSTVPTSTCFSFRPRSQRDRETSLGRFVIVVSPLVRLLFAFRDSRHRPRQTSPDRFWRAFACEPVEHLGGLPFVDSGRSPRCNAAETTNRPADLVHRSRSIVLCGLRHRQRPSVIDVTSSEADAWKPLIANRIRDGRHHVRGHRHSHHVAANAD